MGPRGRQAPRVDEWGREAYFFDQMTKIQLPRQIAVQRGRSDLPKQRRPVLRPEFAVEHAGLLGFGSRGPRRGLIDMR